MQPEELVVYTFDALEAWGCEQDCERPPEQTPLEFARRLGTQRPDVSDDVRRAAQLYARLAYSERSLSRESVDRLESLWRKMTIATHNQTPMAASNKDFPL